MARYLSVADTADLLYGPKELAFLDVREAGQHGAGHPLFATPLPFSRFEAHLSSLVPNRAVKIVLLDDGDGVADRAAERAETLGFEHVFVMDGGAPAWAAEGETLFEGVNVPSKVFGELLEAARNTPHISASALHHRQQAGDDLVVIDGRPFAEYQKMSIPGALCCPNGELALRIDAIAPDPRTTVVVNCAGRTRSILGAQTLIDLGIANPVLALENGTQGWFLAGLSLDHGKTRRYPELGSPGSLDTLRRRAAGVAARAGVPTLSAARSLELVRETNRTTYLFDVRTHEEYERDGLAGVTHAPGGQLVQATDGWVGVQRARIGLVDGEQVRAPVVAAWLVQMGFEAWVVEGGVRALEDAGMPPRADTDSRAPGPNRARPGDLGEPDNAQIIDLRASQSYRQAHIRGARWSIRPRLESLSLDNRRPVLLVAENDDVLRLAVDDLRRQGVTAPVRSLPPSVSWWREAGLDVVENDDQPADADCIDFVFHTHERHRGNAAAARAYLAWETGLVARLSERERARFRILPAG